MARPRQFNEEEIITKAIDLFGRKGFTETSVEDLVCGLNISRASLYNTFGDKKELYINAFNSYRTSVLEHIHEILAQHKSPVEGFRRLFHSLIEAQREHEQKAGCLIVHATASHDADDVELAKLIHSTAEMIKQTFSDYLSQSKPSWSTTRVHAISEFLYIFYIGLGATLRSDDGRNAFTEGIEMTLCVLD